MERAEKIGLGIATAGHVLLFGLLSASFLRPQHPLKLNNPPIDVSIVDEVALKSAAPKISTEPPPPTQAPEVGPEQEAAPAPRVAPAPPPEPKPAPKPEPKPRVSAKPVEPAPKPKPVEKAKPLPRVAAPAPTPVKPKAKPAPAAPTKPAAKPAPAKPATAAPAKGKAPTSRGSLLGPDFLKGIQAESPAKPTKPATGTPAAEIGPAQKAALDAEIRRQLKPYWKSPTGADVEQLRTIVAVELNKDGSIIGTPDVVDTTGVTPSNQSQVRLHREQAVKAIKLAAPFRLPPDLYSGWKSLRISFDKRLSQ